jgi:lysophospholipase L1-like esterase
MSERDMLQQVESERQVAGRSQGGTRSLAARRGRLWAKVLLVLAGTVMGLVLAEIAVRIGVAVLHRDPLIISDTRVGWALKPNLRDLIRKGNGGQDVMSTDEEGHRITRAADERPTASNPTVIVVGDSYIQSLGANDRETFAWILAHEMPVNVVNLGVLGYGTDQELLTLEGFLENHPALDVRDIVVFVTENDFNDVQLDYHYLARHKPRFQVIDGRLDRGHYHRGLSDRLMDLSYLYWLVNSKFAERLDRGFLDPTAGIDVVVACLAAMREAASRRGARFHVLVHHLVEVAPMPKARLADFLKRANATDITERLRPPNAPNPISYDRFHWNLAGHQRVAAIVKERLEAASAP